MDCMMMLFTSSKVTWWGLQSTQLVCFLWTRFEQVIMILDLFCVAKILEGATTLQDPLYLNHGFKRKHQSIFEKFDVDTVQLWSEGGRTSPSEIRYLFITVKLKWVVKTYVKPVMSQLKIFPWLELPESRATIPHCLLLQKVREGRVYFSISLLQKFWANALHQVQNSYTQPSGSIRWHHASQAIESWTTLNNTNIYYFPVDFRMDLLGFQRGFYVFTRAFTTLPVAKSKYSSSTNVTPFECLQVSTMSYMYWIDST